MEEVEFKRAKFCKVCGTLIGANCKSGYCGNCYIKIWKREHYNARRPKDYKAKYRGIKRIGGL